MSSSLTWVDHDTEARDRMNRILALFAERDTRDELGLGGIRDSISDQLFPGTSTIQTRLCYMLYVPWMYQILEENRVGSDEIEARRREFELRVLDHLRESDDDLSGVFGYQAGHSVKRLPSEVYWSGLETWGIRLYPGAQGQYHRSLDAIYRRRKRASRRSEERAEEGFLAWHPGLPDAREGFPKNVTTSLTREEAEYLQERMATTSPSLLAYLALHPDPGGIEARYPWSHPGFASFSADQKHLLRHAYRFSQVMYGAVLLYNLMLCELAGKEELVDEHRQNIRLWAEETEALSSEEWDLRELWTLVKGKGHTITPQAARFVSEWVSLCRSGSARLADDERARGLVREREERLKLARSRFRNSRALDQYGGRAAYEPMDFRWSPVRGLLRDLYCGLGVIS